MARFEEVLPHLRAGRKVRRNVWREDLFVAEQGDSSTGFLVCRGDLLADDWEVMPDKSEPKTAGEALYECRYAGGCQPWHEVPQKERELYEQEAQAVIAWHLAQPAPPAKSSGFHSTRCTICGCNRVWLEGGKAGACSNVTCRDPLRDYKAEHAKAKPEEPKAASGDDTCEVDDLEARKFERVNRHAKHPPEGTKEACSPDKPQPVNAEPKASEERSLAEVACNAYRQDDGITWGLLPGWAKERFEAAAEAVRAAVLAEAHRDLTTEELHQLWQESGSIPTHRSVEALVRKADELRSGGKRGAE